MSGAAVPSIRARATRIAPGIALMGGIAVASHAVAAVTPLSALIVAVATGVVVANFVGTPAVVRPGLDSHKLLLETGIVLLGARLSLAELAGIGPTVVALAAGVVLFGVVYTETLSRFVFGLGDRTGSLLAAGASVCGVSAVVAVAGSIDAAEREIAYAAATVLVFDAVTLVTFPVAAELLGLSGETFGIWAGLSMFSTGPVAAAGFAYSQTAGQWATLTKLVRNAFIGLLVIGYSATYTKGSGNVTTAWNRFPKFIAGFVLVVVVANLGLVSAGQRATLVTASDWLFALAFAGLGFEITVGEMVDTGVRPLLLVLVHLLTVSALSLVVVLALV
ncbi:YeiH family protein [Halorarius litoreus]|uniref:YeiH family protein n=1 Tax=Halorarius litoreus TaxID=2962676 RepID=UPI0020CDD865|nr:putative sulfate exporter family transporter [Halorarius litoreus]